MNTRKVTFVRGYTDPASGDVWKEAVVRCPVFDDEIKAQEACGQSVSQSLFTAHFINQCVTAFGPGVLAPGTDVIRRMHRDDVALLFGAICDLEMGLPEAGTEGNVEETAELTAGES